MDMCCELVGSRQHGVAARIRMIHQREVSCLLNALGDDYGWAQIQMFANIMVHDYCMNNEQ